LAKSTEIENIEKQVEHVGYNIFTVYGLVFFLFQNDKWLKQ